MCLGYLRDLNDLGVVEVDPKRDKKMVQVVNGSSPWSLSIKWGGKGKVFVRVLYFLIFYLCGFYIS